MKAEHSTVLGSVRGSRAGEGGPPSRTFLFLRLAFPFAFVRKIVSASRRNRHASRVCSPDAAKC